MSLWQGRVLHVVSTVDLDFIKHKNNLKHVSTECRRGENLPGRWVKKKKHKNPLLCWKRPSHQNNKAQNVQRHNATLTVHNWDMGHVHESQHPRFEKDEEINGPVGPRL